MAVCPGLSGHPLVGVVDYLTGYEISILVFYLPRLRWSLVRRSFAGLVAGAQAALSGSTPIWYHLGIKSTASYWNAFLRLRFSSLGFFSPSFGKTRNPWRGRLPTRRPCCRRKSQSVRGFSARSPISAPTNSGKWRMISTTDWASTSAASPSSPSSWSRNYAPKIRRKPAKRPVLHRSATPCARRDCYLEVWNRPMARRG